ncbi:MAG: peptidoglycan bridge formation glycyltransferase FemA/FemB family protein [bacterium]
MKIELTNIDDKQWDDFLLQSDFSGFMQSSSWAKVKEDEGWRAIRLAVKKEDQIIAASLLLITDINKKSNMGYSPQGPILDWSDKGKAIEAIKIIQQAIASLAKSENIKFWRIEPWALHLYTKWLPDLNFHRSHIDMQPRHTALIPIEKNIEDILDTFKPKARYNTRLALKNNLNVSIGSTIFDFKTFFDTYKKTVDRKMIDSKKWEYFESIQRHLAENKNAFVVNVSKDDLAIGSILLICFGNRITYFFGGFDYAHRELMAPYLCHYEAIKIGKEMGCLFYDLWGIANTDDELHPWQSFTRFKEGFRPIKISLCGAYDCYFQS